MDTGHLTTGDTAITSDSRGKTEIANEAAGLDLLKDFQVKSYRLTQDPPGARRHIGCIAQEVRAALVNHGISTDKIIKERETITTYEGRDEVTGDPIYGTREVNMGIDLYGLLCVSINAIKQLEARVADLERVGGPP